jgi:hypothetical protein
MGGVQLEADPWIGSHHLEFPALARAMEKQEGEQPRPAEAEVHGYNVRSAANGEAQPADICLLK